MNLCIVPAWQACYSVKVFPYSQPFDTPGSMQQQQTLLCMNTE